MSRIVMMLLIALLSVLRNTDAAEADNCLLRRYTSVDFSMPNNTILIPVTVVDTPALMRFDIQSAISVMWEPVVRRLGVKTLPVRNKEVFFSGRHVTEYVKIPSFSLGHMQLNGEGFLVAVAPGGSKESFDGLPIVGSIGMDFFAKMDFELDFKNRQLNLYAQDHCPGAVVYWTDTFASVPIRRGPLGNAYFPMELDGKKIQASLATGHQGTTLTTDVTKRLYGFDEKSADIETDREPGGGARSSYRAMALTAPGLAVRNARVQLLRPAGSCYLTFGIGHDHAAQYTNCMGMEAPLVLGMDVLKQLHLYFATKENVLYFSEVNAQKTMAARPDAVSIP